MAEQKHISQGPSRSFIRFSVLGLIMIWSTTPLGIKWSTQGASFLFAAMMRVAIGTTLCLIICKALSMPLPLDKRSLKSYGASVVGIYAAMICAFWGIQFIPSGMGSVLFGISPLVTGILAAFWLKEQGLTPSKVSGILLGIGGLAIIFWVGQDLGEKAIYGIVVVVLAASLQSFSSVWVKSLAQGVHPLHIVTGGLTFSLPLYIVSWALGDGHLPTDLPMRSGLAIVYLGIIGSVIGFGLLFFILKHLEASKVSLVTLITPVCALFLGNALNNEVVGLRTMLGTGLILLGLILYQFGGNLRAHLQR